MNQKQLWHESHAGHPVVRYTQQALRAGATTKWHGVRESATGRPCAMMRLPPKNGTTFEKVPPTGPALQCDPPNGTMFERALYLISQNVPSMLGASASRPVLNLLRHLKMQNAQERGIRSKTALGV